MVARRSATRLSLAAALAALVAGCTTTATYQPPQEPSFYRSLVASGAELDAEAAASMISGYRRNNGLGPVVVDARLNRIAKEHALAMAARNQVGHDVGNGPLDRRVEAGGFAYARVAENVAGGYHTLAEAFSGWRDSSGHRKNMLMKDASRIGIAVAQLPGSKYKVFWAMVVAEPASNRVAAAPAASEGLAVAGMVIPRP